jgi:hypothetical protein
MKVTFLCEITHNYISHNTMDDSSEDENIINPAFNDDDDDDDDDDNNTIYDEIYEAESMFLDKERDEGEYILGMYRIIRGSPVFAIGITPHSFFGYNYNIILRYLYLYSIIQLINTHIGILKIVKKRHSITPNICFYTTEVINKTVWLRLIQRHWRKAFHSFRIRQKTDVWELRGCGRRFAGRKGGKVGLQGLMSAYKK